jgi:hypothetical protein
MFSRKKNLPLEIHEMFGYRFLSEGLDRHKTSRSPSNRG